MENRRFVPAPLQFVLWSMIAFFFGEATNNKGGSQSRPYR